MANRISWGQMFAQQRCLPDHCELLDASVASSTRQGEGLKLRHSFEITTRCSTMNKIPNTEKLNTEKTLKIYTIALATSHIEREKKIKSELYTTLPLFSLKSISAPPPQ